MNRMQLENRIEVLLRVYRYTRNTKMLSTGQRICLTMERAACMRAIDLIKETQITVAVPKYTLPVELHSKVQFLNQKAQSEGYDK
jgi:hypothetical protein